MNYRNKIEKIRHDYQHGKIDLDTAKAQVEPMLEVMNKKGEVIAKQHGRKHRKLTFGYVFR